MSLYDQFKTDQDREANGIVLSFGKNSKGQDIQIRIGRAGGHNPRFVKVAEQVLKPHRRQINNETIDNKVLEGLMQIVYARAVILDWSGVEDENGKDMEFTEANVVKVLTDLPDLFKEIRESAEKMSLFKAEALEDEAKNS